MKTHFIFLSASCELKIRYYIYVFLNEVCFSPLGLKGLFSLDLSCELTYVCVCLSRRSSQELLPSIGTAPSHPGPNLVSHIARKLLLAPRLTDIKSPVESLF